MCVGGGGGGGGGVERGGERGRKGRENAGGSTHTRDMSFALFGIKKKKKVILVVIITWVAI